MSRRTLAASGARFVHQCFTRNGRLPRPVHEGQSNSQRKHADDEDNRFRPAGSRLARSSGLRSQRRSLRGRSLQSGMRRSTWRSRRSSRLWWLRLSWRSRRSAGLRRLRRTLLLARRRSRLPLRSCWSRLRQKGGAATFFGRARPLVRDLSPWPTLSHRGVGFFTRWGRIPRPAVVEMRLARRRSRLIGPRRRSVATAVLAKVVRARGPFCVPLRCARCAVCAICAGARQREPPEKPAYSNDSGYLREMAGSVFKTAALNHSAILPKGGALPDRPLLVQRGAILAAGAARAACCAKEFPAPPLRPPDDPAFAPALPSGRDGQNLRPSPGPATPRGPP